MSFETRTTFRPGDEHVNAYKLMTAIVVPRPIAWVSTLSAEGMVNLAPHSFYTVSCARPPIVQFTSVGAQGHAPQRARDRGVRGQPRATARSWRP